MATTWWPLFDLVVRTPRLVLRPVREPDVPALIEAIDAGIHDPATMPFGMAWTDPEPPVRAREAFRFWTRCWGQWTPEAWVLPLLVEVDGRPVGSQAIDAKDFGHIRTVHTGSWLTRSMQGQGIGQEMRAAVLHFAFAGLGAEVAVSEAFFDNAASNAVSRKLGYDDDGIGRLAPRGETKDTQRFRMTRARWEEHAATLVPVEIEGLDGCLELFGVATGQ